MAYDTRRKAQGRKRFFLVPYALCLTPQLPPSAHITGCAENSNYPITHPVRRYLLAVCPRWPVRQGRFHQALDSRRLPGRQLPTGGPNKEHCPSRTPSACDSDNSEFGFRPCDTWYNSLQSRNILKEYVLESKDHYPRTERVCTSRAAHKRPHLTGNSMTHGSSSLVNQIGLCLLPPTKTFSISMEAIFSVSTL